jgi:hypothetical protein
MDVKAIMKELSKFMATIAIIGVFVVFVMTIFGMFGYSVVLG